MDSCLLSLTITLRRAFAGMIMIVGGVYFWGAGEIKDENPLGPSASANSPWRGDGPLGGGV